MLAQHAGRGWMVVVGALLGGAAAAQTTTRASLSSSGDQANDVCEQPSLSASGRFVAFHSRATSLVVGDTNGVTDVFVRDVLSGLTVRASISSTGGQPTGDSYNPSLSADGRVIVFDSYDNYVLSPLDFNPGRDVFLHDLQTGETTCITAGAHSSVSTANSSLPAVSADGRFVAFRSNAEFAGNFSGGQQAFVRDRQLGTTEMVSAPWGGAAGSVGDRLCISADGRFVVFVSSGQLVPGVPSGFNVYRRDRQSGNLQLVSEGATYGGTPWEPSMSADGRFVAFKTAAQLDPADTNGQDDVYVRDMLSNAVVRVSVGSSGSQANSWSGSPSVSGNGRFIAFESPASNLYPADMNNSFDVFIRDMWTGVTSLVSLNSIEVAGNSNSRSPAIGDDGLVVAFYSESSNLVPGDTNGIGDVFHHDRTCTGAVSAYCTAKTNSLGCTPSVGSVGLPSQSGPDNFYVTASNVLNNKLGMMLWSLAPASTPFFGGTLCLQQPITRTPAQYSGGSPTGNDCTGTYAYHFTQTYMLQQLLGAGTVVYCQYWSRDPGFQIPNNIGLTDGLRFTICP